MNADNKPIASHGHSLKGNALPESIEPRSGLTTRREFLGILPAGLALPVLMSTGQGVAGATSKEVPVSSTGSSVGSLYPFLEKLAVHDEFPISWLQPQFTDLGAWRQTAKAKVQELMQYAPPHCLPEAEVVERVDKGDYWQETVRFNTTPDVRIPASVLIPKKGRFPAPGIVALHDHGAFFLWGREKLVESDEEHPALTEFKRGAYGGISIAAALARQGYVVIVTDMFYWGERRILLDGDPEDWRTRPRTMPNERVAGYNQRSSQLTDLVGRTITTTGATWYGILVTDDLRTVDYLASRPEVDPQRLGCVGLSVGGFRSGQLAALDERIKAAVAVGWMCSYPRQLKTQINHTIGPLMHVPGLYRHLDYPDIVSLAAPRALMVINGSKDGLFQLDGVKQSFEKLKRCWAKAGVPEKINCRLFDTPHEFNPAMQAEAWVWLKKWV
jgi:hypothetical protein